MSWHFRHTDINPRTCEITYLLEYENPCLLRPVYYKLKQTDLDQLVNGLVQGQGTPIAQEAFLPKVKDLLEQVAKDPGMALISPDALQREVAQIICKYFDLNKRIQFDGL